MTKKIVLRQGDYFELLKDIPDESIDLILTDIPYNVSRRNNFKSMKDRKGRNGIDFGEWDNNFDETGLVHLIPKLKKGGSLFLFHAIEQFSKIEQVLSELEKKDKVIWEKTNPMPRNRERRYICNIEMATWYVKKGNRWCFNRQSNPYDSSVFRFPSESGGGVKRYHPCQKNLRLIEQIVSRHSNEGETVLDPFMGSGTTGVACINTGRNFIGIELNEGYFKIAEQRIVKALDDKKEDSLCPLGGDETDDCSYCCYSSDYHFSEGECVLRNDVRGD